VTLLAALRQCQNFNALCRNGQVTTMADHDKIAREYQRGVSATGRFGCLLRPRQAALSFGEQSENLKQL